MTAAERKRLEESNQTFMSMPGVNKTPVPTASVPGVYNAPVMPTSDRRANNISAFNNNLQESNQTFMNMPGVNTGTPKMPTGNVVTNDKPVNDIPTGNVPTGGTTQDTKVETKLDSKTQHFMNQLVELKALLKSNRDTFNLPGATPEDIQGAMGIHGQAIDRYGAPYDMQNDPIFQNIANFNDSQMLQNANSRGLAMSGETQARTAQARDLLGLQFQESEQARRQQDINNRQGQVNQLVGMNQTNYNRSRDTFNDAMGIEQNMYNRSRDAVGDQRYQDQLDYSRQQDRRQQELQTYGFELNDTSRGLMDTFTNMNPQERQNIQQYDSNYAERMNQLDVNSPEYQQLNAARFNKIMQGFASDPQTMAKYLMNDYGLNPMQVSTMARNQGIDNLNIEKSTIGQYYSDFQQEINNRMAKNPNDPLIPVLKIARNEKISAMNEAQMNMMEKMTKQAMDLWKLMGVADESIAEVLGVAVGAKTADYYDAQGRLKISQAQLGIQQQNANTSAFNAQTSRANQQRNQALFDLQKSTSEDTQILYSEFIKSKADNPNLTIDQFLSSTMGEDRIGPGEGAQGPVQINSVSYIDTMTFKELQDFVKIAKEMGHIAGKESALDKALAVWLEGK